MHSCSYLPNPSARAGYDTRSIFKRCLTGLNSEFSFSYTSCLTKAEEPSLPNYLPIAGGRISGFIPFSRELVLCETQSVSSRIWTRDAVSISYDDNHNITGTSYIAVVGKFLLVDQHWHVHVSRSMSLFLFLQQCSTCLVRLTWMILVMGDRQLHSNCFVGCCFQDMLNITLHSSVVPNL